MAIHAVEEQPIPYLVMEYIAGETLQQKLDRVGPLDTPEVLQIGRQVAAGLAAAHALGLIHRDIKPSNILLETGVEQRARITDFGLARAADDASLTQSGVVAGTPMYMAPEQAQGESIDQRADLFSLGSVLYVMCSGRPPFRASTTMAVLKRVAEDTPRRIREIIPDVPEWLCAIVVRLHAKSPGDRFASAKDVADLLSRHLASFAQPTPVPPSAPSGQASAGPVPVEGGQQVLPVVGQSVDLAPPLPGRQMPRVILTACLSCGVLASILWAITWFSRFKRTDQANYPAGAPARSQPALAEAPFSAEEARQHQEAWARHLGTEVEVENSAGMKLALIPAGKFLMGSPDEEPDRKPDEGPRHEVVLTQPFYLGVHDVTVRQFKTFVQATGYRTEADKGDGAMRRFPDGLWKVDPQCNWQNPGYEQTDNHPVVCVSWNDAQAFCDGLSRTEHRQYALPTEAQWEFACRAGTQTRFYHGGDDQELAQYAWCNREVPEKHSHPVGRKMPNAWGLYDMEGNVWQWTADRYAADYYHASPVADPRGPVTGSARVQRGGAWSRDCRAALRLGLFGPSGRTTGVGFRVAFSP